MKLFTVVEKFCYFLLNKKCKTCIFILEFILHGPDGRQLPLKLISAQSHDFCSDLCKGHVTQGNFPFNLQCIKLYLSVAKQISRLTTRFCKQQCNKMLCCKIFFGMLRGKVLGGTYRSQLTIILPKSTNQRGCGRLMV